MTPVPWPTKIGVGQNHRNKTDFHKLLGATPPILGQWPMYRVGVR
jgi:hypothetical protein